MTDDSLDDLLRDYSVKDASCDKATADARRAYKALMKEAVAYEALRNCCADLHEKKYQHPVSNGAYLLDLAKCVTALHASLTDEARARLTKRLDTLHGAKRLACELLLYDHTTSDVFEKLKKASRSPSLLDAIQRWLRFGPRKILF